MKQNYEVVHNGEGLSENKPFAIQYNWHENMVFTSYYHFEHSFETSKNDEAVAIFRLKMKTNEKSN